MPPCGTFDYTAVAPWTGWTRPWRVGLTTPVTLRGDALADNRLVGHSPSLTIEELTTEEAGRYGVLRLTLRARRWTHAQVKAAAFHVDRALFTRVTTGDVLHLRRHASGALGLTIVRDNRLFAAAGDPIGMPVGEGAHIRLPSDLIQESERVYKRRDPAFELREVPVELQLDGYVRILSQGAPRIGAYDVFVRHACCRWGTDLSIAISLKGVCPDVAAVESAQLMDGPHALAIESW